MLLFTDTNTPVPAHMTGWARCGHQAEGTDPFRSYIDDRAVVDVLSDTAIEGEEHCIRWAGDSGWYETLSCWHDGRWEELHSNAPWQMRV